MSEHERDDELREVDIDPNRPSLRAVCPFCGGTYIAGWLRSRPKVAHLAHSDPVCERYAARLSAGHPAQFLTEAREAGAERHPIHEGGPLLRGR